MEQSESPKVVFSLGRIKFAVKNCDPEFESLVSRLLPAYSGAEVQPDEVYEVRTGCDKNFRTLLNHLLKKHYKCIWLNGACLVSPEGRTVLLSGGSGAGKSTISLALSLAHKFTVLAEDVVLFDTEKNQIIRLATPFSLKEGTAKLVQTYLQRPEELAPEELVMEEWLPLKERAHPGDVPGILNAAFFLEGLAAQQAPLQLQGITEGQYLRKLLPQSNILRRSNALQQATELLTGCKCQTLSGGTIPERIGAILKATTVEVAAERRSV